MTRVDRLSFASMVHLSNRRGLLFWAVRRNNCKFFHYVDVSIDLYNKKILNPLISAYIPVMRSNRTDSGKSKSITASNWFGFKIVSRASAWLFLLGNPSKQNLLAFKVCKCFFNKLRTSVSEASEPVLIKGWEEFWRRRSPVEMWAAAKSVDSHLDIVPFPEA